MRVPLQNMEHRRGSWDGWGSTNCTHICTSRKCLWPSYFYPVAKDRIQQREGKELFFTLRLHDTIACKKLLLCSYHTKHRFNAFLSKPVHHKSHLWKKKTVWGESENSNYRFNIKAFKYFMTDWENKSTYRTPNSSVSLGRILMPNMSDEVHI